MKPSLKPLIPEFDLVLIMVDKEDPLRDTNYYDHIMSLK